MAKAARDMMGMPISVEIVGGSEDDCKALFDYFAEVDARFSTYRADSEISRINRGELAPAQWSASMREVFALAEETNKETAGYFDIVRPDGGIDPSGLVKGWAVRNAARLVEARGYENYFLNVGGDIACRGVDEAGREWTVGIRSPFDKNEIIKVVVPRGRGVATSGSYIRGAHIYNPHAPQEVLGDIVSLTVVAPDIHEADRFATAAFAMGKGGIAFIESLPHAEGYAVDARGVATMTTGFKKYVQ